MFRPSFLVWTWKTTDTPVDEPGRTVQESNTMVITVGSCEEECGVEDGQGKWM